MAWEKRNYEKLTTIAPCLSTYLVLMLTAFDIQGNQQDENNIFIVVFLN